MTPQFLPIDTVRYALAKMWLAASGAIIVILGLTLGNVYAGHETEVFGWALPYLYQLSH